MSGARWCGWRAAVGWGLVVLLAASAAGELAKVHLKDGRVLEGDVALSAAYVFLRTDDEQFKIAREAVARVELLGSARDLVAEYQRRFEALPRNDVASHFALARWAYDQDAWTIVVRQCNYVLSLDPQHHEAKLLRGLAENRLEQAERGAEPVVEAGNVPLLGANDINRLKFYELGEQPPRGHSDPRMRLRQVRRRDQVENEILAALEATAENAVDVKRQYRRGSASEKLRILVKHTGAQFADRVNVSGDPYPLTIFRRQVMPLIAQGCMTSACHGGQDAPFPLPRGSWGNDDVAYTTFLLLSAATIDGKPMFDRAQPDRSALIDLMMAEQSGRIQHPRVDGEPIAPLITRAGDTRYETIYRFVEALSDEQPRYDLTYEVPALDFETRAAGGGETGAADDDPADEGS